MATNDVNLQVINSMTQDKMNSLKDANGKIPSLANQIIMTDEEDVNLSQVRMSVLWTNPSPSSSFASQTITLSSSDYDYLMVVVRINASTQYFYSPALIKKGFGGRLSSSDTGTSSNYKIMMQSRDVTRVSDTQYTISDCRYSHDTVAETGRNDLCVPYQILGLKIAPAMIYTGAELHEGDGISIENGVISVNNPSYYSFYHTQKTADTTVTSGSTVIYTESKELKKGKYFARCYGLIKTSSKQTYLSLDFDGVNILNATTNNTAYSSANASMIFEVKNDGIHTLRFRLESQSGATGTLKSYCTFGYVFFRIGD